MNKEEEEESQHMMERNQHAYYIILLDRYFHLTWADYFTKPIQGNTFHKLRNLTTSCFFWARNTRVTQN